MQSRLMRTSRRAARGLLEALAAVLLAAAAGCTAGASSKPATAKSTAAKAAATSPVPAAERYTLHVLASTEVTDMEQVLDQVEKATGVKVVLTPTTTSKATTEVISGQAGRKYDAVWLSTDRYLQMSPGGPGRIMDPVPIMLSPVIVGVRPEVARQLGWDRGSVTWSKIAAAVREHRFTFGMTDPASTNAGRSALVEVATALDGGGGALHGDETTQASPALREFFAGQTVKASSPHDLDNQYVRAESGGDAQGGPVDGLIDYESDLVQLKGRLRQPLDLIYPADGVVTADYPLSLLSRAAGNPGARAAFGRLVSYLLRPVVQREIMTLTNRRPASPKVALDPRLHHGLIFELPFPATEQVVDNLIDAYYGRLRRPGRTVYVIDISQAMAGQRLGSLKKALGALTGATAVDVGTAFQSREQITFEPFATEPYPPVTFDIPPKDPQHERDLVQAYIDAQAAGGGSAVYAALTAAYRTVEAQAAADPDRITTIVLLTVGNVTSGSEAAFERFYRSLPASIASVPVFPVLYSAPGSAATVAMDRLAAQTGGQAFSARELPLATVLGLIRENQ